MIGQRVWLSLEACFACIFRRRGSHEKCFFGNSSISKKVDWIWDNCFPIHANVDLNVLVRMSLSYLDTTESLASVLLSSTELEKGSLVS